MVYDLRNATVEEIWERLKEFFAQLKPPYTALLFEQLTRHGEHSIPPRLSSRQSESTGSRVQVSERQAGDFSNPQPEDYHAQCHGIISATACRQHLHRNR